jgi:FkbM family methyltransferase
MYTMRLSTKTKIYIARILHALITFFTGSDQRVIVRGGIRYHVDLTEGIDLSLYLFGNFQKHIFCNKYYKEKPDDVILDVGANIGSMTLQFAQKVPQGRVYAFEPTQYALDKLMKNCSLNPILAERITVINTFVSVESAHEPDIQAYSSWKVDSSHCTPVHEIHLGAIMATTGVSAISIDDFVQENKIKRINYIKIDTDGHEYKVLKGSENTIARFKPVIIFEISKYLMVESNTSFQHFFDLFQKFNYQLFDSATDQSVDMTNFEKLISDVGATDLIAVPK